MNDPKKNWLTYAKTASSTEESTTVVDKEGFSFILEWQSTDILSPSLAAFKKDLSTLAAEKLSESELAFLKADPEAASSELFLGACKPFLEKGIENADWHAIQETIKASVKQFYFADLSKFGSDMIKPLLDDVYFCTTIRSQDAQEPLGFLLFAVTPALPFGDVKVINFFLRENDPDLRAESILMGSIFKILPEVKRIFLFARPTDLSALKMYATMGFERDENPFQDSSHKINPQSYASLDYKSQNSKALQKAVKSF